MITNCSTCFSGKIPACAESILLKLGLAASTTYKWRITDEFDNRVEEEVDTDGSGYLTIDVEDLPDGFLNPHTGTFKIEIFTAGGLIQPFEIDDVEYTCLQVDVFPGEGEAVIPSPNNTAAPAPDPGETYLVID